MSYCAPQSGAKGGKFNSCGNLATADTPCSSGKTEYRLVDGSEVNIDSLTLNEDGTFCALPVDPTVFGSFKYSIWCEGYQTSTGTVEVCPTLSQATIDFILGQAQKNITLIREDDKVFLVGRDGNKCGEGVDVCDCGVVEPQCGITNLLAQVSCVGGDSIITLSFDAEGTSGNYVYTLNGTPVLATDNQIVISGPDEEILNFEVSVTDAENDECSATVIIDIPVCTGDPDATIETEDQDEGVVSKDPFTVDVTDVVDANTQCGNVTYTLGVVNGGSVINNGDGTFEVTALGGPGAFEYTVCCENGVTCDMATVSWVAFDCPDLQKNIGDSCDDGDACTENSSVQADCECGDGTPIDITTPCECEDCGALSVTTRPQRKLVISLTDDGQGVEVIDNLNPVDIDFGDGNSASVPINTIGTNDYAVSGDYTIRIDYSDGGFIEVYLTLDITAGEWTFTGTNNVIDGIRHGLQPELITVNCPGNTLTIDSSYGLDATNFAIIAGNGANPYTSSSTPAATIGDQVVEYIVEDSGVTVSKVGSFINITCADGSI